MTDLNQMDDIDQMAAAKWTRNDAWVGSEVEDSFIMINIDNGNYVALNETAKVIWDALATPVTQSEIEAQLSAQFAVAPETCANAVQETLIEMQAQQIARVG